LGRRSAKAFGGIPRRSGDGGRGGRRSEESGKTVTVTPVEYHDAAEEELLRPGYWIGRVTGMDEQDKGPA
jgi:hypothetical protein